MMRSIFGLFSFSDEQERVDIRNSGKIITNKKIFDLKNLNLRIV
jgi:hypothetical protein